MAEARPPSHIVAKRISERGRALAGAERVGTIWSPSRTSDRRFIVVCRREGQDVDVEIVDGAIVDVRERKGVR